MARLTADERATEYPGAERFMPGTTTLAAMREAVQGCRGCPLYRDATQAVFGEGRVGARLMLVGEVPGDEEDLRGRPFVGPAGRLLDQALEEAGIAREDAYLTNVVKHFKWEPSGKRRIHKTPNRWEIAACIPWLDAEIARVSPAVLVAMGATAAKALFGPSHRVSVQHGQPVAFDRAPYATSTVHPSAVLRRPTEEDRVAEFERLVADLRSVAAVLAG
ncbi:MAG TPA: UdgX family uracil-DNA binding protein [Trueperaceae bacterium]